MTVAIVIPTASRSKWPYTECIAGLIESTAGVDVVLVIEVSSGPDFTFSKAINRGMNKAPSVDAWILLNDDCFMDSGWLQKMLAAAAAHPNAGVIGALLRYPNGRIQHSGAYVARGVFDPYAIMRMAVIALKDHAPVWLMRQLALGRLQFPSHRFGIRTMRLDTVTGACMLITRECVERIGLFDELYPLSFEDTDYCLRAREAGLDVLMAMDVTGVHVEEATTGGRLDIKETSFGIFCDTWPFLRIRNALSNGRGIIHPDFCQSLDGERRL